MFDDTPTNLKVGKHLNQINGMCNRPAGGLYQIANLVNQFVHSITSCSKPQLRNTQQFYEYPKKSRKFFYLSFGSHFSNAPATDWGETGLVT